jgi:hypothetical protein
MATGGITVFVVAEPDKLKSGVCKRCGGWSDGWGAGWNGKTTVTMQHCCGEVRNAVCSHCGGTGIEPPHFVYDGTWYKPWTLFSWHYEDEFGVQKPAPPSYPTERYP